MESIVTRLFIDLALNLYNEGKAYATASSAQGIYHFMFTPTRAGGYHLTCDSPNGVFVSYTHPSRGRQLRPVRFKFDIEKVIGAAINDNTDGVSQVRKVG